MTLSNGTTITIATGASSGTASVRSAWRRRVHRCWQRVGDDRQCVGRQLRESGRQPGWRRPPASPTRWTRPSVRSDRHAERGRGRQHRLTPPSLTSVAQAAGDRHARATARSSPSPPARARASVSVPAPTDDVSSTPATVSATINTATGGNFREPCGQPHGCGDRGHPTRSTPPPADSTATPSVAEGGSIVYTASLTGAAQTPVTRDAEQRRHDHHRRWCELGHG